MTKQSIDLKYRCEGKLNRVPQKAQAKHGVQTSVPMFVRSATLKEGIRPRAGLLALGVRREQTGVKVKVEEAIEVLGEVWGGDGLCDCMSPLNGCVTVTWYVVQLFKQAMMSVLYLPCGGSGA